MHVFMKYSLMLPLAGERYVNFYAEPGPYLGSTHNIERPLRTAVIVLLLPLLFFAPDIHYNTLYEIWEKTISKTDWSAHHPETQY